MLRPFCLNEKTYVEEVISFDIKRISKWIKVSSKDKKCEILHNQTNEVLYSINLYKTTNASGVRIVFDVSSVFGSFVTSVIPIVRKQPLGGVRLWFSCPGCGSPRKILYFFDTIMACRKCFGLTYESQHMTKCERKCKKAIKLDKQLGGDGDIGYFLLPSKPKGMHASTYLKKLKKLDDAVSEVHGFLDAQGSILLEDFKRLR